MKKIKIAIIGYGNVGKGVHYAINCSPDMVLSEIITRDPDRVKKQVKNIPIHGLKDFKRSADVAILCSGSKEDVFGKHGRRPLAARLKNADQLGQGPYFAQFFNTVDSFDTHARIPEYFACMSKYSRANKHTALIAAGWDPGTFSLERVMADAFVPCSRHYTFWGPGVSQGHSDAVRSINGVIDARQYTLPVGNAVKEVRACKNPRLATGDKHKRLVFVVAAKTANKKRIELEIKTMPHYFADYETKVIFIAEAQMKKHAQYPHGGFVLATRAKNKGNKALIEYRCEWGSNSEATGSILVACARACYRFNREKRTGAFTMLDVPPAYYSAHSSNRLLKEFI